MRDPGLRSEHRAELQVGALVLVATLALVAGVVWATGADVAGERYRLYALTDEAKQVSEGSRVYVRGVDVGSVRRVQLAWTEVLLSMEVSSEVTLPTDSRAVIQPSGFLGSQMVRLVPGRDEERLAPGDTLRGATTPDLQSLASTLSDEARDVLDRASTLLSDTTVRSLRTGALDLSATMTELRRLVETERATLSRLVENLERTSEGLAGATSGPELERTVAQIDTLTRRLADVSEELGGTSRSLSSILAGIEAGEGSLGLLVNDERLYEEVTAAAENLRAASEEIGLLTRDIRQRPERYLREMKFSVF